MERYKTVELEYIMHLAVERLVCEHLSPAKPDTSATQALAEMVAVELDRRKRSVKQ